MEQLQKSVPNSPALSQQVESQLPQQTFPVNSEIIKVFAQHGSPILLMFLLCWFFKILTRFIEVCQKDE
jgi:hypothetical protein